MELWHEMIYPDLATYEDSKYSTYVHIQIVYLKIAFNRIRFRYSIVPYSTVFQNSLVFVASFLTLLQIFINYVRNSIRGFQHFLYIETNLCFFMWHLYKSSFKTYGWSEEPYDQYVIKIYN